jgi:tRNA A37 threonylcarbamoyladenosine dehydratase
VDLTAYDYVIDAVDTVAAKVELAARAHGLNIPMISSMGAGNKMDPAAFYVTDIFKTAVCPLAKAMREQLRKRGVPRLKVVCSREAVATRAKPPGSNAFVPAVAGLIMAGEVVGDLIRK